VLTLAEDARTPLLERASSSRSSPATSTSSTWCAVAGLKRRMQMGLPVRGADGLLPREQLERIAESASDADGAARDMLHRRRRPALSAEGVAVHPLA
jgi:polyphosphate kinase